MDIPGAAVEDDEEEEECDGTATEAISSFVSARTKKKLRAGA
jgi:hypothetical protein